MPPSTFSNLTKSDMEDGAGSMNLTLKRPFGENDESSSAERQKVDSTHLSASTASLDTNGTDDHPGSRYAHTDSKAESIDGGTSNAALSHVTQDILHYQADQAKEGLSGHNRGIVRQQFDRDYDGALLDSLLCGINEEKKRHERTVVIQQMTRNNDPSAATHNIPNVLLFAMFPLFPLFSPSNNTAGLYKD